MKLFTRSFVNPLLALAFKDGIDFTGDRDLCAMEPKKVGPNKWDVIIECYDDDTDADTDDEDYSPPAIDIDQSCGQCVPCANGENCITAVNEAIRKMAGKNVAS